MNILILGAGAIGRLFAALFNKSGADVGLLCRDRTEAAMLAAHGFFVRNAAGISEHYRIPAFAATETPPEKARLIIVCVKAYNTEDILPSVLRFSGPNSTVISMQNGLGNLELLVETVKPGKLYCASTSHGSTRHPDGSIDHCGTGITRIAPFVPKHRNDSDNAFLRNIFLETEITAEFHEDYKSILWSKLAVNCGINPVTAIHGITNGELLAHKVLYETACKAADEAAETARRMDITLLFDNTENELAKVLRLTADNKSSMLQDIQKARQTEVREINGKIITEAEKTGIDPAVNRSLMKQVLKMEEEG